jgi:hypothetical protein
MRFFHRAAIGAVAGLVAGIAVAIFFLIEGAVHLRPFAVPVALASGLLGWGGAGGTAAAQVANTAAAHVAGTAPPSGESLGVLGVEVLVYTVIHLLTFAAVGAGAGFLLGFRSFWRSILGGVVYGSIVCTGLLYASGSIAATPVSLHDLGLPSVLLADAMAGAILGLGLHLARSAGQGEAAL